MQFDLTSAIQIHIPKKIEILRPDSKKLHSAKKSLPDDSVNEGNPWLVTNNHNKNGPKGSVRTFTIIHTFCYTSSSEQCT